VGGDQDVVSLTWLTSPPFASRRGARWASRSASRSRLWNACHVAHGPHAHAPHATAAPPPAPACGTGAPWRIGGYTRRLHTPPPAPPSADACGTGAHALHGAQVASRDASTRLRALSLSPVERANTRDTGRSELHAHAPDASALSAFRPRLCPWRTRAPGGAGAVAGGCPSRSWRLRDEGGGSLRPIV